MFHVEHGLFRFICFYAGIFPMFHVERVQNYVQLPDVPRGTLNNDTNATNAQMPSRITKG
jgi:hypothetical protein